MEETPEQYTTRILGYVEGKKPLQILRQTPGKIRRLLKGVRPEFLKKKSTHDSWSSAEILAHLADSELVMAFRLRLVLGSNGVTVQAFDQNAWARYSKYPRIDPHKSLERFSVLREGNVELLKKIPADMWNYHGMHTERGKESVTRMVEMFAGHDLNHFAQLKHLISSFGTSRR